MKVGEDPLLLVHLRLVLRMILVESLHRTLALRMAHIDLSNKPSRFGSFLRTAVAELPFLTSALSDTAIEPSDS